VFIKKDHEIYVPNVFSPNGDGINDKLTVYGNSQVTQINLLRIFDRWGEVLYEHNYFPPNEEVEGWDGRWYGQEMNPGVYIWIAEIQFNDGHIKPFSGEVTLIK